MKTEIIDVKAKFICSCGHYEPEERHSRMNSIVASGKHKLVVNCGKDGCSCSSFNPTLFFAPDKLVQIQVKVNQNDSN